MAAPNPTLYIHNLNDKINKDEISLQLYSLFSTFGSIIYLGATKGKKMKGQAFVTFADLAGATAAMRSCEGMTFYDKPLRIEYAKTKSYATLKREDPDFVSPSVLKAQSHPPSASMLKRTRHGDYDGGSAAKKRHVNGVGAGEEDEEMEMDQDEDEEQPANGTSTQTNGTSTVPPPPIATNVSGGNVPTSTLVCTNLPMEVTDEILAVLFQQYRGFQSTQTYAAPTSATTQPSKMAQVIYDSPDLANVAKEALDGFTLKKGWVMGVQFS